MPVFRWGQKTSKQRSTDRLPPGQHLTKGWPVLHEGPTPQIDPERWSLRVFGAVQREIELGWRDFGALPRIEAVADFHCVTTWSRYDNRWAGVAAHAVLDLAQPTPQASHVLLHCADSVAYTTNLPLSDFAREGNLFATHHDGAALDPDHGGPVRFVCHHLYAWKSAKWVCGVELLTADQRGYWEERGYHKRADPWLEERYSYQEDE